MIATSAPLPTASGPSQPGGGDLYPAVTHWSRVVPALLLLEIQETHRQRQDLLRAELRLNNQVEAVYRRLTGLRAEERARLRKKASSGVRADDDRAIGGLPNIVTHPMHAADRADDPEVGDGRPRSVTQAAPAVPDLATFLRLEAVAAIHTAPLVEARALLANSRRPLERRMELLARELPVWPWAEAVRGFGPLGLAQIAGECGDLASYDGPARVWKRMGLAVIDGEPQGRRTDPAEALVHGYSPQRRSIMHVLADSLMKGNREGPYRTYYLAEKARQREKLPDAPAAHIHNRALRHMAKRLLRDLWRAWRAEECLPPTMVLPDHDAGDLAAD